MDSITVKFALIGAGRIAAAYVEAIEGSNWAELVAVVDICEEAASSLARELGCLAFTNYEDLEGWVEVDAVLVCTPPASHSEICRYFLERGTPVMCEKPLCLEPREAIDLVEISDSTGAALTMASKFRFVDEVVKARKVVESGAIGEVIFLENAFTSSVDMSDRWNSDPWISGGGVLIDSGTHSVDIVRFILGPIASVQAVGALQLQNLRVEDTVRVLARTEAGQLARIDLSWTVERENDCYLEVYGSGGSIRVGWDASGVRGSKTGGWTSFGSGYDQVGALRRQIDNFSSAVRGHDFLRLTGEDALASVAVIHAAYRSLSEGGWVEVEEPSMSQRPAVVGAFGR